MKQLLIIALIHMCAATLAYAKPIKVAVIDTGRPSIGIRSCDEGSMDFTGEGLEDREGHGTNVVNLIAQYAGDADYCIMYLKYYTPKGDNLRTSIQAWKRAIQQKADVIIYAGGGKQYSGDEEEVVKQALAQGAFIFAAAGNEETNLEHNCNYYPACLDWKIVKVGCKKPDGTLCTKSNYAKNLENFVYADGFNRSAGGYTRTGTSQATAVVTGRFIKYYDKHRKAKK